MNHIIPTWIKVGTNVLCPRDIHRTIWEPATVVKIKTYKTPDLYGKLILDKDVKVKFNDGFEKWFYYGIDFKERQQSR